MSLPLGRALRLVAGRLVAFPEGRAVGICAAIDSGYSLASLAHHGAARQEPDPGAANAANGEVVSATDDPEPERLMSASSGRCSGRVATVGFDPGDYEYELLMDGVAFAALRPVWLRPRNRVGLAPPRAPAATH